MQLSESYLLDEEWDNGESSESSNEEQLQLLRNLAKECINCFFLDKQHSSGGPIPGRVLFHDKNINMVIRTEMVDGIDRVYKTLENLFDLDTCIEKVLKILTECGQRFIPKEFAPGLMIMYFRLCEGLSVE